MKMLKNTALIAAMSAVAMGAQAGNNKSLSDEELLTLELSESNNCIWQGPYVKQFPTTNYSYPDTGALYWSFTAELPEGAKMSLQGDYPQSRYFSFNAYTMDGSAAPYHSLRDNQITPRNGVTNPFVTGNNRVGKAKYEIDINPIHGADENVPQGGNVLNLNLRDESQPLVDNAFPNFNYTENMFEILYRIYVPNDGATQQGNVNLPRVVLELADGTVLKKQDEVCAELQARDYPNPPTYTNKFFYEYLRTGNNFGGAIPLPALPYPGNPVGDNFSSMPLNLATGAKTGENYYFEADGVTAQAEAEDVVWRTSFSIGVDLACSFLGVCLPGEQTRKTGFYANLDNNYLFGFGSSSHQDGPVMVSRGKVPTTPTTFNGDKYFDDAEAQVRYWSFCTNEFFSQRVTECVYDEQVKIDEDRNYVIVASKAADRPANATEECGYNWIEVSELGDNYVLDGDDSAFADQFRGAANNDEVMFLMRNMAPAADFEGAIQNITRYRDEKRVLGDYMPSTENVTKEAFEALPCRTTVN